jgi:hypothetical protein
MNAKQWAQAVEAARARQRAARAELRAAEVELQRLASAMSADLASEVLGHRVIAALGSSSYPVGEEEGA